MKGKYIKLFKIQGVPVEVSMWCLIMVGLSLAPTLLFLVLNRNYSSGFGLTLAILVVGLEISVLIHEMAHALSGLALGFKVTSIKLNVLGGATYFAQRVPAYFRDAIVIILGPLSNLVLWQICNWAAVSLGTRTTWGHGFEILGLLNLLLAIFNAIPAYPLDGGQFVYSLLMGVSSDQQFSTRVVLFTSFVSAGVLIWRPGSFYPNNLITTLIMVYTAFWIVVSCLVLRTQAKNITNFYPTNSQQHAYQQKQLGKWQADKQSEPLFERGLQEMAERRYASALGSFTQALDIEPNRASYLERRAEAYFMVGEPQQALLDYNVLLSKPQAVRPELYVARARVYNFLGAASSAHADLQAALQLNPNNVSAILLETEMTQPQALPQPAAVWPTALG